MKSLFVVFDIEFERITKKSFCFETKMSFEFNSIEMNQSNSKIVKQLSRVVAKPGISEMSIDSCDDFNEIFSNS